MAEGLKDRNFRDKLKLKERGARVVAIIAMGASAMVMAGCGPSNSNAEHVPTPPAATASQTPGPSETSPSQAPSSSETAPSAEMKLTSSEVFNNMSAADQATVEKDSRLSFDQFEQLDANDRSLVQLVLMDANSKNYIEQAGKLTLPGNHSPLGDYYVPATGQHINIAESNYKTATTTTRDQLTVTNDAAPYFYTQYAVATAFNLAKTGNAQDLEYAKKIVGGLLLSTGDQADANHGNLAGLVSQLEQVSTNKADPDATLHFPQAGIQGHDFTSKAEVVLTFNEYNPATQMAAPGPNELGQTAAGYQPGPVVTLKDGTSIATWRLQESSSEAGGGTLALTVTPDN